MQMKGVEMEALLHSVNPLCEMAEEAQAHEVQMKGDHLHDTWQRLRRLLNERVELMQTYVRVHTMALQVSEAWDVLQAKLDEAPASSQDHQLKEIQELWLNGKQKYVQLTHLARNFMADALKVNTYVPLTAGFILLSIKLPKFIYSTQIAIYPISFCNQFLIDSRWILFSVFCCN